MLKGLNKVMKKLHFLLLLLSIPMFCQAQFFGLAGQYAEKSDGQFVVNLAAPTFHKKNIANSFVSSGLEFSTSGGAKMSGLHLKPIQFATFFSEDLYNNKPYTILAGVDVGYLFDFRRGRQDAITITPNIYFDYKVIFMKAGYDFDVLHGNRQFFVRAGICLSIGTFKIVENTKIW